MMPMIRVTGFEASIVPRSLRMSSMNLKTMYTIIAGTKKIMRYTQIDAIPPTVSGSGRKKYTAPAARPPAISPIRAAHGKSLIGFSMRASPAIMNRIIVFVSMFVVWVCHEAAPVTMRRIPTKKPKNEMIFVNRLMGAPTTGTGLTSFSMNHDIARTPPIIRISSALFTKMLKSIFCVPSRMLICSFSLLAETTFNPFPHP